MKRNLCWLDLETTGSDETKDDILEIGFVITRPVPPFEAILERNYIICPSNANWLQRLRSNTIVREMHLQNGLLLDVITRGMDSLQAQEGIESLFYQTHGLGGTLMLAGSGVGHFDRRFLRAHYPDLEKHFHFPVLDVGVIRRTLRDYAGREGLVPEQPSKPHRALDDARLHLDEFRHYVNILGAIPAMVAR